MKNEWQGTLSFDSESGIRERLFLLSQISVHENPANWAYSPRLDSWQCASGETKKVAYEGSESLRRLAERGINYATAMKLIGHESR